MADSPAVPITVFPKIVSPASAAGWRIVVLKLDHHGDFVIGLPALELLRHSFPEAHITVVVGSWNAEIAARVQLFDAIIVFDRYPENAQNWDGRPIEDEAAFREKVNGAYDIAIDLRVDEDTRSLLTCLDAQVRCGIGSRSRFPFLDWILPAESWFRAAPDSGSEIVHVELVSEGESQQSRFVPSELHIGESLELLVRLVVGRLQPKQSAQMTLLARAPLSASVLAEIGAAELASAVFVAPFSNSTLRNWPLSSYEALIRHLLEAIDGPICLIGAQYHHDQFEQIRARLGNSRRVVTFAGTISWSNLPAVLARARLVISNNSGIAHVAAASGAQLLAIYSGSHEPGKWGPRGIRARTITAKVSCAPCGLDRLEHCSFGHQCMQALSPEIVLEQVMDLLNDANGKNNSLVIDGASGA